MPVPAGSSPVALRRLLIPLACRGTTLRLFDDGVCTTALSAEHGWGRRTTTSRLGPAHEGELWAVPRKGPRLACRCRDEPRHAVFYRRCDKARGVGDPAGRFKGGIAGVVAGDHSVEVQAASTGMTHAGFMYTDDEPSGDSPEGPGDALGVITVRGEIDAECEHILEGLADIAVSSGMPLIALDLTEVELIDASNIGVLIELRNRLSADGRSMKVASSPAVNRVFGLLDMRSICARWGGGGDPREPRSVPSQRCLGS